MFYCSELLLRTDPPLIQSETDGGGCGSRRFGIERTVPVVLNGTIRREEFINWVTVWRVQFGAAKAIAEKITGEKTSGEKTIVGKTDTDRQADGTASHSYSNCQRVEETEASRPKPKTVSGVTSYTSYGGSPAVGAPAA